MPHVLIVDDVHSCLIEGLQDNGFLVHYEPDIRSEDIVSFINAKNIEGLVVRSKCFIGEVFLKSNSSLKWIARAGAGMDNIDEKSATEKGIILLNAGNANSNAVAEHTLGMIIGACRNLTKSHNEVIQGIWEREGNRGVEISGKKIGIIGFGNIGSLLAQKLSVLGMQVFAFDKYKKNFGYAGVKEVDLPSLMEEVEILSLHVPLTIETTNMINDEFIEGMKKPFLLINTARGPVVNYESVLNGLNSGKVTGLLGDVFEVEPPSKGTEKQTKLFQDLCHKRNVMFSPHVAGWTVESYRRISEVLLHKILKL